MDDFAFLSDFYDEFVGADYEKIARFIHRKIFTYCSDAVYGVDLGCGSGTLTYMLAKMGFDMIGIDRSEAMLAQAVSKKQENDKVLFLQQDLTEIDLYGAADFMVSTLDCINYLEDIEQVRTFFEHCNTFLKPNGLLIFDFNSLYKYAEVLDGNNFVYETEDVFCIWENEFDGDNMHYDLTYFVRDGKHYDRYDEYQKQTFYTVDQIKKLLDKSDFEILSLENDYDSSPILEQTERYVLTARKRSV